MAVLLLLLSTTVGCAALAGQGCTDVGGTNGIGVDIVQELWVAEGDVAFTVCDDEDCESATKHMALLTKGQGGGRPQIRGQTATFEDLGRTFDDGTVHVTVELVDHTGRLVARREQDVELTRYWPNGKACDGDGYVSGHLELMPEDAVAAPA
jgi:hypothetical protein